MKVTLSFKEVNSDFSHEYADMHHNGDESAENVKYNWDDEMTVTEDIKDFKVKNRSSYFLRGTIEDESFEYEIPDMTICECITSTGQVMEFAVSRKLIKETDKKINKDGDINFTFFLKDNIEAENPMDGVYIADKDFPEELR